VIAESAVVDGEVRADHIIINGVVNGAVHAKMLLELQPKARIRGDVFTARSRCTREHSSTVG
jgi:cytoskeletal protein CcmA (bactofilin family)